MRSAPYVMVALLAGFGLMASFAACGSDDPEVVTDAVPGGGAVGGSGGTGGSHGGTNGGHGGEKWDGSMMVPDANGLDATADTFDPDAACATANLVAKKIPSNLLFVIDRTGSMNCNVPPVQSTADCNKFPAKRDNSKPSKWEIVRGALISTWEQLGRTSPVPSAGVMFFNSGDGCDVPSKPDVAVKLLDAGQQQALKGAVQQVVPKGDTPIIGAMMRAYQYIFQSGDKWKGTKFVVLLTDGAETCDPGNKSWFLSKVSDATKVGIRTFVLGAPGSESERAFLSSIAFAGGTASKPNCKHGGKPDEGDCHMDMTTGADFARQLADNLDAISREALSCRMEIPKPEPGSPPLDFTKVNVIYKDGNGQNHLIYQDDKRSCDDPDNHGWQYTWAGKEPQDIVLCKGACDTVKSDKKAELIIQLGCETQTRPK